ncbi:fibronectin type III domain-containing protein, partial [Candidatus Neomarinimicrobiota bacterium]
DDTTHIVTDLANNTLYYFRVTAVDVALNESEHSNEASAMPLDVTPAPPQDLAAIAGEGEVFLTWRMNTEIDIAGYRIYANTSTMPDTLLDSTLSALDTTKAVAGLDNDTTYTFTVTAVDDSHNESAFSNEVTITPSNTIPPEAPVLLSAVAGPGRVTLTWRQNHEIDFLRYRIYYGTAPEPASPMDSSGAIDDTVKTITGLTKDIFYYFRITAVDVALNESASSDELSAMPQNSAPVAVNDTITVKEDSTINFCALDNDSDVDGEFYFQNLVLDPGHGNVTLFVPPDTDYMHFSYTPNPDYFGADTFSYSISDYSGLFDTADTAEVFITVTAVNDKPTAFALLTPPANTILSITSANLSDSLDFAWGPALDVDGDTIEYIVECTDDLGDIFVFDTTDTILKVPHADILLLMETIGKSAGITGTWNILACDGLDTTWSSNGPFYLTITNSLTIDFLAGIPEEYALHPNYPNPFNPSTTLQFDLPAAADIRIVVYDLLGREVVRLVEQRLEPGYHQLVWKGRDRRDREVPTGVYIVLMVTPEYSKAIKMVLLK